MKVNFFVGEYFISQACPDSSLPLPFFFFLRKERSLGERARVGGLAVTECAAH